MRRYGWGGGEMDHALVNPNQLRSYGITVQDNPFADSPIFISTEGHEFTLPLSSKGTTLGAASRTPTDQELQTCPHVILSSEHEWDPQNVHFPQASRTVEEEINRTISTVMTQGGAFELEEIEERAADDRLYDIGTLPKRMIASTKVHPTPRKASQVGADLQDVPQAKSFQSKGRHSTVTPEDLSERWQIGLEQAKETLKRTTQRMARSAVMPLVRHGDRLDSEQVYGSTLQRILLACMS
jgi:hypothetical protein